jgi:hypothetical protein
MKGCHDCDTKGVVACLKGTDLKKLTKKQLIETIEDILETKQRGGKL